MSVKSQLGQDRASSPAASTHSSSTTTTTIQREFKASEKQLAIIVVGATGSGKSSFISFFREHMEIVQDDKTRKHITDSIRGVPC